MAEKSGGCVETRLILLPLRAFGVRAHFGAVSLFQLRCWIMGSVRAILGSSFRFPVNLKASTCSAISVATFFRRLILKCVAPIHDLMVAYGCSTVMLRTAGWAGSASNLSCTRSSTSSFSHPLPAIAACSDERDERAVLCRSCICP